MELPRKSKLVSNIIDEYWINGEIYLLNSTRNGIESYFIIIVDVRLNKDDIFNRLKREENDLSINHIDYLDD